MDTHIERRGKTLQKSSLVTATHYKFTHPVCFHPSRSQFGLGRPLSPLEPETGELCELLSKTWSNRDGIEPGSARTTLGQVVAPLCFPPTRSLIGAHFWLHITFCNYHFSAMYDRIIKVNHTLLPDTSFFKDSKSNIFIWKQ